LLLAAQQFSAVTTKSLDKLG